MRIERHKQLTGKTSRSGGIRGSESFFWNLRNSASIKAVAAFFAAANQLLHDSGSSAYLDHRLDCRNMVVRLYLRMTLWLYS
jgi:hypothetical protein